MLGVTILASLPESVGEISVDGKLWTRERYCEWIPGNITTYTRFVARRCL